MKAVALTLLDLGDTDRELHLFDTFEGMPPPGAHDARTRDRDGLALLLRDAEGLVERQANTCPRGGLLRARDSRKAEHVSSQILKVIAIDVVCIHRGR